MRSCGSHGKHRARARRTRSGRACARTWSRARCACHCRRRRCTSNPMREDRPSRLWMPYAMDVVGPFVAYLVVRAFGASAMWALSIAGVLAGASTVVNSVRRGALDAVGALVMLELVASVVLLATVRDARLLLIRPSFYTGLAAAYLLASAF